MNRSDLKNQVDSLLPANPAARSITPAADNTFRKLVLDNVLVPDDDTGTANNIVNGDSSDPMAFAPDVLQAAINSLISSALSNLSINSAGYLGNYATVGDAPTAGVPTNSVSIIGGEFHKFDGSDWINMISELNGTDVISLIDGEIGTAWKSGGSGGSGGSGEYLVQFDNVNAAPTDGVPDNAIAFIGGDLHQFDGTDWNNISDELTDAELVSYINNEIGNTDWQSGGSGGSSSGFDWTQAVGGFSASDQANWAQTSGDLTSIQDLKSAQSYVPTNAGDLLFDGSAEYFSANAVDAKLDTNNGNNNYLSPGAGVFTMFGIFLYNASNSDRHIKFQNNGGSNTYKINPTGVEIRNNGVTTETIAYTFTSGTTLFYCHPAHE